MSEMQTQMQPENEALKRLLHEVDEERTRLRARPPKSVEELVTWFIGTGLSIVRDNVHHTLQVETAVNEQAEQIQDLYAHIAGDATQFSVEDAEKFRRVLEYARSMAELQLQQGGSGLTGEQKKVLETLLTDANECIELVETTTIEPEPESDDDAPESGSQPA
jgi:hypothetical protein